MLEKPEFASKSHLRGLCFPTQKDFELGGEFVIEYTKKGEKVTEDVADKIYATYKKDGNLVMRLASGMVNLRPDRVLDKLNKILGENMSVTGICKIAQYVDIGGDLVDADEFVKTV